LLLAILVSSLAAAVALEANFTGFALTAITLLPGIFVFGIVLKAMDIF